MQRYSTLVECTFIAIYCWTACWLSPAPSSAATQSKHVALTCVCQAGWWSLWLGSLPSSCREKNVRYFTMSHKLGLLKIDLSQPTGRGCDVGYRFLSGGTKALLSGNSYVLLYSLLNCGNQPNVYIQKVLANTPLKSYNTFPQKVSANKPLVLYSTLHNSHKKLFRRCWLVNKPPHHYTKVMSWGGGTEHKS